MKKSLVVVAMMTAVAGYGAGVVYATVDETPRQAQVETAPYAEDLPPLKFLGNGMTVGEYRVDTPLDERPDFVETRLDGRVGYIRLSDISDGFVFPSNTPTGESVDVTDQMNEALRRQKDVMVQPDEKGEVWVSVYDSDGQTVIGKKLVSSRGGSSMP